MRLQPAGAQLNLAINTESREAAGPTASNRWQKWQFVVRGLNVWDYSTASFLVITVRLLANKHFLKRKSL